MGVQGHKGEIKLTLSLTCFPKEVLLDDVGLMRPTGGEAIKTVPTALFVAVSAPSLGLLEISMEEQDHTPGSGRGPEETRVSPALFCLELLCSMEQQGPRTCRVLNPVSGSFSPALCLLPTQEQTTGSSNKGGFSLG